MHRPRRCAGAAGRKSARALARPARRSEFSSAARPGRGGPARARPVSLQRPDDHALRSGRCRHLAAPVEFPRLQAAARPPVHLCALPLFGPGGRDPGAGAKGRKRSIRLTVQIVGRRQVRRLHVLRPDHRASIRPTSPISSTSMRSSISISTCAPSMPAAMTARTAARASCAATAGGTTRRCAAPPTWAG